MTDCIHPNLTLHRDRDGTSEWDGTYYCELCDHTVQVSITRETPPPAPMRTATATAMIELEHEVEVEFEYPADSRPESYARKAVLEEAQRLGGEMLDGSCIGSLSEHSSVDIRRD